MTNIYTEPVATHNYDEYTHEEETAIYTDDLDNTYDEIEAENYNGGSRRVLRLLLILLIAVSIVVIVMFVLIPYVDAMSQPTAPPLPPPVQT